MKINQIKEIAKGRGIATGRMRKTELVHTLQIDEGNQACFQTGQVETCGQEHCLWRQDCA